MKIYQLITSGKMALFGEPRRFHSKKVFRTRSGAENYKDEFREICTTEKNEFDLVFLEEPVEIKIAELELV